MFIYDEKSMQRVLTPWGKEVKKRLVDRNMKQQDLVNMLIDKGFNATTKGDVSNLLYGIGAAARTGEINAINTLLQIPTATQ